MKSMALAVAVLVVALAAGEAPAAVPADPWSLVPPLPMACYGMQDDFDELVAQRLATLSEELDRQTTINEKLAHVQIVKDSSGKVDPWEMSRRMTESMMKNPQSAGQAVGQAVESAPDDRQASDRQGQKERDQKAALAALFTRYNASLNAATAGISSVHPLGVTGPLGDGVSTFGGSWWSGFVKNPQERDQVVAYSRKIDQFYETRLCPEWWKTGPFHNWLAGYRAFLTADIPRQEGVEAKTNAALKVQGVNLDGYHSTVRMEAVKKFLLAVRSIYVSNPGFYGRWEHPGQPPTH